MDDSRKTLYLHLSKRESQIMDVLFQLGEGTVAEVQVRMPGGPTYNTVRNTLAVLEEKGHVRHRKVGKKYAFSPTQPLSSAKESATRHLMNTFFGGSASRAILALIDEAGHELTAQERDAIASRLQMARRPP